MFNLYPRFLIFFVSDSKPPSSESTESTIRQDLGPSKGSSTFCQDLVECDTFPTLPVRLLLRGGWREIAYRLL